MIWTAESRHPSRRIHGALWVATSLGLLVACGEEAPIVEEIRSLETVTIGEATAGQVRKFSGIVRAVDRSALSFEVAGNVLEVNVDIGDAVSKGQVLAVLDKEPYELEVQKAEAELATAEATLENQAAEFERQKVLFQQEVSSQRQFDLAELQWKEAKAGIEFAESKLDLAKRDLRKTILVAPYDGTIGVRNVDPFVEVRQGQKLFEIEAEGRHEVRVNIPETVVHLVKINSRVTVSFPRSPNETLGGVVSDVGTLAGEGNSFPVKVALIREGDDVRSGMTAEVTFELDDADFAEGFPIVVHAITPTSEANHGFVFVYQADTSTVKRAPIRYRGARDNRVIVNQGLSPGDIVAVAGVSFLSDGMKVKLMEEPKSAVREPIEID